MVVVRDELTLNLNLPLSVQCTSLHMNSTLKRTLHKIRTTMVLPGVLWQGEAFFF